MESSASQEPEAAAALLLQRLDALEQSIARLRQALDLVASTLASTRRAKACLEELKSYGSGRELLVSVDGGGVAFVKVVTSGENPIVHVGLDVYVQADYERAASLLSKKESLLSEQMRKLQEELGKLVSEYRRLQEALQASYGAPAPRQAPTGGRS